MENEQKLLKSINNISSALRLYKGTYEEHVQLQADLKLIIETLNVFLEEKKQNDETKP